MAIKSYLEDGVDKWTEVYSRVGDKILFQSEKPSEWSITVAQYKQQYAGPDDYIIFDRAGDGNSRARNMFTEFLTGDPVKNVK